VADDDLDEPRALVLWCTSLPELRSRAVPGGWAPRLEREAGRVRDGGSAVAACRKYKLGPYAATHVEETRGPLPQSGDPLPQRGIVPVRRVGRGNYRCPQGRCPREDTRDEHGHPPTCGLFDEPMLPST
jgi:hypothetical protein